MFKKKKPEAPVKEKSDKQFEAKFKIDQEMKSIKKYIEALDTSIAKLTQMAVSAKSKNYNDLYRQLVSQIAIAESRKRQSETFIGQTEVMREIGEVNGSMQDFTKSISAVTDAFDVLHINSKSVAKNQKTMAKVEMGIEKQSYQLEDMLDIMGGDMDTDISQDDMTLEIENRIANMMCGGSSLESSDSVVTDDLQAEIDKIKRSIDL